VFQVYLLGWDEADWRRFTQKAVYDATAMIVLISTDRSLSEVTCRGFVAAVHWRDNCLKNSCLSLEWLRLKIRMFWMS
jgi:hypothetical protein